MRLKIIHVQTEMILSVGVDRIWLDRQHNVHNVNLRLELQVSPERFKGSASTTNLPRWSNYVISLRQGRRLTLGAIRGWLRCTESRQSSRSSYSGWVPTINSFRWRLQCHPGQLHATRTCGIDRCQHFLLWNSNSSKSGSLSVSQSLSQSVSISLN